MEYVICVVEFTRHKYCTSHTSSNHSHLFEDGRIDVGQWHNLFIIVFHAEILQHGLDGDALLGNLHVDGEDLAVGAAELDAGHDEGLEGRERLGDLMDLKAQSVLNIFSDYNFSRRRKKIRYCLTKQ